MAFWGGEGLYGRGVDRPPHLPVGGCFAFVEDVRCNACPLFLEKFWIALLQLQQQQQQQQQQHSFISHFPGQRG